MMIMNLMKADLQRMLRSKGFYIWLLIFTIYYASQLIGMNTSATSGETLYTMDLLGLTQINGSIMPQIFMSDILTNLYFLAPVILITINTDFSSGTIKNLLASGIFRTSYYIAKLSLIFMVTILIQTINVVLPTIAMTVLQGFGTDIHGDWLWQIFQMFILQTFILIGVISIGITLSFTVKKTVGALGSFIALTTLPSLIIFFLGLFEIMDISIISRFEPITLMNNIIHLTNWQSSEIFQTIIIGAIYLLVSITLGIGLFEKAEIK